MNVKQTMDSFTDFFKTLKGFIVGLTGVIVAFLALIELVHIKDNNVPACIPSAPYVIIPEEVPCYLINTMKMQDSLYWFHVDLVNKCEFPLNIQIEFVVRDGPAVAGNVPALYTVYPDSTLSKNIDPRFDFVGEVSGFPLEFIWKIFNEDSIILQGTNTIAVSSREEINWDLKKPDGRIVSKEFLVASLTAWIRTPDDSLKNWADRIGDQFEEWYSRCYQELATVMVSSPPEFSMEGRQNIRLPSKVWTDRKADLLEAALLFASLNYQNPSTRDLELSLFIIHDPVATPVKSSYLLAWRENSTDWTGFDLAEACDMTFGENVVATRSRLLSLLDSTSQISSELRKDGVFVSEDRSVVAINFNQAADFYDIWGLP